MEICNYVRKDGGLRYCIQEKGLGYCTRQAIKCAYSDNTLIMQTVNKKEDGTYKYLEFSACRAKITNNDHRNCKNLESSV